ncbi:hypothetical protein G7062_02365 [Erysipelothrix sp. HDW6C]|uniref:SdrD B-like domain-containing protein n=1 Tax=Erysipelothrix sp. HDW6C TaxID=2714930 RepID=UPI00140C27C2|nr:SdrD B-like domain-containing protein [Erysipelothrix sp. HDW6C]QIK69201.1 hypothetical protein G7062_02365 [Erysipelothrix sp. HDW6C]
MKRIIRRGLVLSLTLALLLTEMLFTAAPVMADETAGIDLNGLVQETGEHRLDEKTSILSSGNTVGVTYRLVPNFTEGEAQGTRVKIYLPSFTYSDGKYAEVPVGSEPTALGIHGEISASDDWIIHSSPTKDGGWLELEYRGNIRPGSNPAFEVKFSTYSDGSNGPYGSLPEGITFNAFGYVSYASFNSYPDTGWETANQFDPESKITMISSNLKWEANIKAAEGDNPEPIPMWDRYQYIDYTYAIENTSSNLNSIIEGYTVTFNVDSTADTRNGILTYDINRYRYNKDAEATLNEDPGDTTGLFVGVPEKGGILIYDITDWKEGEKLPDPIPYTYSGVGVIEIDQNTKTNNQKITPEGATGASKRIYRISLPMSRQGFPDLPTDFQVTAITNVIFASDANWSKTSSTVRSIAEPSFAATIDVHAPQNEIVFGEETVITIDNLVSGSNVPTFDSMLEVQVDAGFHANRIHVTYPRAHASDAAWKPTLETAVLSDKVTGQDQIMEPLTLQPISQTIVGDTVVVVYDMKDVYARDGWSGTVRVPVQKTIDPKANTGVSMDLVGQTTIIGPITITGIFEYVQYSANNGDLGAPTEYLQTINRETTDTLTQNSIYPKELVPLHRIVVGETAAANHTYAVDYDSSADLDIQAMSEGVVMASGTYTASLNPQNEDIAVHVNSLTVQAIPTAQSITFKSRDGKQFILNESNHDFAIAKELTLAALGLDDIATIRIDFNQSSFEDYTSLVIVHATINKGVLANHTIPAVFDAYQGVPFNKDRSKKVDTKINIKLPQVLSLTAQNTATYGSSNGTAFWPSNAQNPNQGSLSAPYEGMIKTVYRANTQGVIAPTSTYTLDFQKPSGKGYLTLDTLRLTPEYLNNADVKTIDFVDIDGKIERINVPTNDQTMQEGFQITLKRPIQKVTIYADNLKLSTLTNLIETQIQSDIDMGTTQIVKAELSGTQHAPYPDTKTASTSHAYSVAATQSSVSVRAVHQVETGLGVKNTYTNSVYRYLGYPYYIHDYTLDMGYKSIGGFVTSLTRPTSANQSNDQVLNLTIDVPETQFDMYYIKIQDKARDYVTTVDIYRKEGDKEVLWQRVSADEWVSNTQEGAGFWRINVARPENSGTDLFASYTDVEGVVNHPYYKSAWEPAPENPVSKVVVNFKFDRQDQTTAPQMSGSSNDLVETMGRFYAVSEKEAKTTTVTALDTFGLKTETTRTANATIKSAVMKPYAYTKTGVQDKVTTASATVLMGQEGVYVASLWNKDISNAYQSNNHWNSVSSEYVEWIADKDYASFHDVMLYEFVFPNNPTTNKDYNFATTSMSVTPVMAKDVYDLAIFSADSTTPLIISGETLRSNAIIKFDTKSQNRGVTVHDDGTLTVALGENVYPTRIEMSVKEIVGHGDGSAEIKGRDANTMGITINDIDVRFAGIVNGNMPLIGTSNVYRLPSGFDQKKTLMHTSSAQLSGYTPRLGATVGLSSPSGSTYDYQSDGITPTSTRFNLDVYNNSEADIKDVKLTFKPDSAFRMQTIQIPASIFSGEQWAVSEVGVVHNGVAIAMNLKDIFVLEGDNYRLDTAQLFETYPDVFKVKKSTSRYSDVEIIQQSLDAISVTFSAQEGTLLYGSLARNADATLSNHLIVEGAEIVVDGNWVDPSEHGNWDWNSRPAFVSDTTNASTNYTKRSVNNVSAFVTPAQPIYVNNGGTNNSQTPSLNLNHDLYNRIANVQLSATMRDANFDFIQTNREFSDTNSLQAIAYNNVAVGDQITILYELKNNGNANNLPVFNPTLFVNTPKGLKIADFNVVTTADAVPILDNNVLTTRETITSNIVKGAKVALGSDLGSEKNLEVHFGDTVLQPNESVYAWVTFAVINDFGADVYASQNQTMTWNAYAKPDTTHHYFSYDVSSTSSALIQSGRTDVTIDYDKYPGAESVAHLYNTAYRNANPNQLKIVNSYDVENISGQAMRLQISDVINEVKHDETTLWMDIVLNTDGLRGFVMTKFPTITYPNMTSKHYTPTLTYRDKTGVWQPLTEDTPLELLMSLNEIRVSYGVVGAYDENGEVQKLPEILLRGVGHWQQATTATRKDYPIKSSATLHYQHEHDEISVAFKQLKESSVTTYKGQPSVGLNIQSFDTEIEATAPYNGTAIGKTSYLPLETFWYKITAENIKNDQGLKGNTAYGKGPLNQPIIIDKVPEYVTTSLDPYIDGEIMNVESAIAAGALDLKFFTSNTSRDFIYPEVHVSTVQGRDVGGSQAYHNTNTKSGDGWYATNNEPPKNTALNPAKVITYRVFTYTFKDEKIDRGERIELAYAATAREHDLPTATYKDDGRTLYAPYLGNYGPNNPVVSSIRTTAMDMASLRHDVGITGVRNHEEEKTEFLASSYAYAPGSLVAKNPSSNRTVVTFYDQSANNQVVHQGFLNEGGSQSLYTTVNGTTKTDVYDLMTQARVEDGAIKTEERILWAQDSVQLSKGWLYSASEMVPDTKRQTHGVDAANFYEHDDSLNHYNIGYLGYTPYLYDDYTYAVQLHEMFTIRMHAINYGDASLNGGIEFLEVLPVGISPYDANGELSLIATLNDKRLDTKKLDITIIQTPQSADPVYTAPETEGVPYVVRIRVDEKVGQWWNRGNQDEYQLTVSMRVRVEKEVTPNASGLSLWRDTLRVSLMNPSENPNYEIYDSRYGGFNRSLSSYDRQNLYNDAMVQGMNAPVSAISESSSTSYYSFEPYGLYVRGLNSKATTQIVDGEKQAVAQDVIAMRKPTLRIWTQPKVKGVLPYDDTFESFVLPYYETFELQATVENVQLEAHNEYNRNNSGYSSNQNDDIWRNAPQTIGGARGAWFEPVVTMTLSEGIEPVDENGQVIPSGGSGIQFNAMRQNSGINTVSSSEDITRYFDVTYESINENDGSKRGVLKFTSNDAHGATVGYLQNLVITPKVKTVGAPSSQGSAPLTHYQDVLTVATSRRDVFNPVVSSQHTTGSVPSQSTLVMNNGSYLRDNDRKRRDSSSTWAGATITNPGMMPLPERMIAATQSFDAKTIVNLQKWSQLPAWNTILKDVVGTAGGAWGSTSLRTRRPSIQNQTTVGTDANGVVQETALVDPAGKFWIRTTVSNPTEPHVNPYVQLQQSSDIYHSTFVMTYEISALSKLTDKVRIATDRGILDRPAFEALGYKVDVINAGALMPEETRQHVQFKVTLPPDDSLGIAGRLKTDASFTFMFESQMIAGYETGFDTDTPTWQSDALRVDSFVSIEPIEDAKATVVQEPSYVRYLQRRDETYDIDRNGTLTSLFAFDGAMLEVIKPAAQIRKNTSKPRELYSNGKSGDTYFNTSEVIDYMMTYVENTGSSVKEFVVEDIIPTTQSADDSINTSKLPINTDVSYVSTGSWLLPDTTLVALAEAGLSVDDVFQIHVYVSNDIAVNGYEPIDASWTLLNPHDTSLLTNTQIPLEGTLRKTRKVRWVITSRDTDNFLIPTGFKLNIDADPDTPGIQDVIETDPENHSVSLYPSSVTDAAIHVGVRAESDAKTTLFIHNTAQVWSNYVEDYRIKSAQSETRSYLTPSRPVVNVEYSSRYYRSDSTGQRPEHERFGWSDIRTINPPLSPYLKFKGRFINGDDTMWASDESHIYKSDALINPNVTFMLPRAMMINPTSFTYVAMDSIDSNHALHDDYRSQYVLKKEQSNMWTWRVVRKDGTINNTDIKMVKSYTGPWRDAEQNVVNIRFEGSIAPGDVIEVEFIGEVNEYEPASTGDDLKSSAYITNNTGLLQPLNSRQNNKNILGYGLDTYDFDENGMTNDRLVFAERTMFEYANYDNFGKRKVAYSDLNKAGTIHPYATPVSEGHNYRFEISLDNSKAQTASPYPYPMMYDVLPHLGDTNIMNTKARNSAFKGWLQPDSIRLTNEGINNKTYGKSEYTVYVGPFTKDGNGKISKGVHPNADVVAKQQFYTDMLDAKQRNAYFVSLSELGNDEGLLKEVESIMVLFTNPQEALTGQQKLKLSYELQAPINAPVLFEEPTNPNAYRDYVGWNSFVGTQKVVGFMPQESNMAGSYVMQYAEKTAIGNYIWFDANYDGIQNEGTLKTDANGRQLLQDFIDLDGDGTIDDPGINGVRVTLKSPNGYDVDAQGRSIVVVDNIWYVIDESTGDLLRDDVFNMPIIANGPTSFISESDINGNAGYYILPNIASGNYRLEYVFPKDYDTYGLTTPVIGENAALDVYEPQETYTLGKSVHRAMTLTMISSEFQIDATMSDARRMAFDVGLGETIDIGGNVFLENPETFDGYYQAGEKPLPNYQLTLRHEDGTLVRNLNGKAMTAVTDRNGNYQFKGLPLNSNYRITIQDENGVTSVSKPISPFIHNTDPRAERGDNDGYRDVEGHFTSHVFTTHATAKKNGIYEMIQGIDFAFYQRTTYGSIGNRVWDDRNRDGIQQTDEPGLANQLMILEQYRNINGEWVIQENFMMTTQSNHDGYYYFDKLPTLVVIDNVEYPLGYRVRTGKLLDGYTVTLPHVNGSDATSDSDFFADGSMRPDAMIVLGENVDGLILATNNLDIDLGLVEHARGGIHGKVWDDIRFDGINHALKVGEETAIRLEVYADGHWQQVMMDANGKMELPESTRSAQKVMQVVASTYAFENLYQVHPQTLIPFEYRLVAENIDLTQRISPQRQGTDRALDSDFVESDRSATITAMTDGFTIFDEAVRTPEGTHPLYTAQTQTHIDLGLHKLSTHAQIGNRVWNDHNRDGIQNDDEVGVEGVKVQLQVYKDQAWVAVERGETTTDEKGNYTFNVTVADEGHIPYQYRVLINREAEHAVTLYKQGDETLDNDFRDANDDDSGIVETEHTLISREIQLVETDVNGYADYETVADDTDVDAGLIVYAPVQTIGDLVYHDRNNNGQFDMDDVGLANILVKLEKYNRESEMWEPFAETNTNEDGFYEFKVLAFDMDRTSAEYMTANQYRVAVVYPNNMVAINNSRFKETAITYDTTQHMSVSDTIELVEHDISGRADRETLRSDVDVDLGMHAYSTTVTIGNRVWMDVNEDGIEDAAEVGVENVRIDLQRFNEELQQWVQVDTRYTDALGNYQFDVAPTDFDSNSLYYMKTIKYRVRVFKPEGTLFAKSNVAIENIGSDGEAISYQLNRYDGHDLTTIADNLDQNFGLVVIKPKVNVIVPTGNAPGIFITLALVSGFAFLGLKKKRDDDEITD